MHICLCLYFIRFLARGLFPGAALALILWPSLARAQFPPQAGMPGSTAVPRDSPLFTGWADQVQAQIGWIDIADKSLGKPSSGSADLALGPADFQVVSLGDSGVVTLIFDAPIYNGPGPDFAVFENGFKHPQDPSLAFLELAFVEVSDNGVDFYRFPASYQGDTTTQIPGAGVFVDAAVMHNLAGKYVGGFGTPFDLEDLKDPPGLDLNHITHIRLVDVIGQIGALGSRDKDGRIINDPYPTDFAVGGFDLDAVGAFYQKGRFPAGLAEREGQMERPYQVYPNPVVHRLHLHWDKEPEGDWMAALIDPGGAVHKPLAWVQSAPGVYSLDLSSWPAGPYILWIRSNNGRTWTEKLHHYPSP